MKLFKPLLLVFLIFILSCDKEESDELCCGPVQKNLIIKLKFDPNQERLDNFGQPANIPVGNAAQSPTISRMSANYIEFAPHALTALGAGEVIFKGEETTAGGSRAIDFQKATFAGDNEVFMKIPLDQVTPGEYNWVRVSLAYQEGNIDLLVNGIDYTGTLASFVGFKSYISSFNLNESMFDIHANKLQGFWAFETQGFTSQGQAPEGATTVPNPLFGSSPIPQGSCVVTGQFENGFTISGDETEDVEVTLSFSINNSFEWTEVNADGKYEPEAGEQVVDMGLRGLIPVVN
ncbi:hypothetical protein [Xanthomarina sp. F2636L]|uniref:hypothetical protein n=1 Tax=Xanthomarina sp. F2636L TaxID=2996018 RepID=UPI00225E2156|nr:hypothetical protein [Xanthomarina sp. F2636L]MCX7551076.1 hypothetical protein [Xanthomarina sp. F2636L]